MNENQKWVIGIDLDGTTLLPHKREYIVNGRREDHIHPITIEVIKQLTSIGHHVVIVTGRNYLQSKNVYEQLGLKGWIVNSAGGHIHNPSDPSAKEYLLGIPNSIVKEVLADEYVMKDSNGWCVDKINDTYLKAEKNSPLYNQAFQEWTTQEFDGEFDFDPQCFCIHYRESRRDEVPLVVEYMREKWEDVMHSTNWGTFEGKGLGMEANPSQSNKGTALLKVADELGIPHEFTIGIGDGENDLEMIKKAAHGVAMNHAVDYIKKHAQHITTHDNSEGGVGIFLKDFFNL